jgi:hypothetical protein
MNTTPAPASSRYAAALPAGKSPYMLLFRDASSSIYKTLSSEQRQQLFTQWYAWYDRLAAEGKLIHGHPLEEGGRVVSARNGRVTDGPFTEAKEVVGGYFFLAVNSLEEAVAIAKECPTLKHEIGLTVEVRLVAGMCPVLVETPGAANGVEKAQAKA